MILADKIMNLRKKSGMSQEDLANQINVSRQAVSKWESAQSIPDLDKIILMSQIFGVSTDYLLKDDIEELTTEQIIKDEPGVATRRVTLEMADDYIDKAFHNSKTIGLGVVLCILSPVLLILLSSFAEYYKWFSEDIAYAIGLISMFVLVAIAVVLFIVSGHRVQEYKFLSEEAFETDYGVTGKVKQIKKDNEDTYFRTLLIGIIICILSVVPLLVTAFTNNDIYVIYGLVSLFGLCSVGVFCIVFSCCKKGALNRLLQEGYYAKDQKKTNKFISPISCAYWCVTTAVYLIWSFLTNDWEITWIVWVIASILYAAIFGILNVVMNKDK